MLDFIPVIQPVHLAIVRRLADPTDGFNPNFAAALANPNYSIPYEGKQPINWSVSGPNVGFGRLAVPESTLTETATFAYPFVLIDVVSGTAENPGRSFVFSRYSGPVRAFVQFLLSWESPQIIDFASWQNAVVDAMLGTVNNPPTVWDNGITYAGQLEFQKSPVRMGGESWLANVDFAMTFEVSAFN